MNKTLLATLIAGSIALTGCNELEKVVDSDGDKISDTVVERTDDEIADAITNKIDGSYIPFNLSLKQISLPTDFLKGTDGLLSRVPQDGSDIAASLSQLDGWGLGATMSVGVKLKADATLDDTTLASSVYIFKGTTALTYGVDYVVKSGTNALLIVPLTALSPNTQYSLVVTDALKDSNGEKLKPSLSYTNMATSDPLKSIEALAATKMPTGEKVIYSAPFKTQSIEPVMQAVMDQIATAQPKIGSVQAQGDLKTILTATVGSTAAAAATAYDNPNIYYGGMVLPYFLDTPTAANCASDLSTKGTCGALTSYWVSDTSAGTPLGKNGNYTPAKRSDHQVQVMISIPSGTVPTNGWPVVVYVHGITSYKETGFAIAGNLAAQGIAMVAIDLPLHGSRSIDLNSDDVYDISVTDSSAGAKYANGSPLVYANLGALRNVRDNLRQSISDILSLRAAVHFTPAYTDASSNVISDINIDTSNVTLLGVSLGSIVGTGVLGTSDVFDGTDGVTGNPFEFKAAALTVGGTQAAPIMGYSNTFGPTVKAAFKKNTAFLTSIGSSSSVNKTAAELAAMRDSDDTALNSAFNKIVDAAYPTFLATFATAAQQVVDGGDAIGWAQKVKSDTPVLVTEIVGNGSTNLSDQTVPNSVATSGFPLAGTEPLISTLGLTKYSSTATGTTLKAATQFMLGKHTSLLDSSHTNGVTQDATAAAKATVEMQTQVIGFLKSNGTALKITDSTVVK